MRKLKQARIVVRVPVGIISGYAVIVSIYAKIVFKYAQRIFGVRFVYRNRHLPHRRKQTVSFVVVEHEKIAFVEQIELIVRLGLIAYSEIHMRRIILRDRVRILAVEERIMVFAVRIFEHVLFVIFERQLVVAVQIYVGKERILAEIDIVEILAYAVAVQYETFYLIPKLVVF